MLETLLDADTRLFRWVNGHHCTMADWMLWCVSQHWCWLIVLLVCFCMLTLRQDVRSWWVVLLGIVMCFFVADEGSVHLFKNTVCRLRPCHALEDVRMFRTQCGGAYGFVSSHAANVAALCTLLIARYRKHALAVLLLVAWGALVCYSRVYLGKHYPADVLCGAIFGVLCGAVVQWLTSTIEKKAKKSGTK